MTLVDVGFMHHDARVQLLPWIFSGDLQVIQDSAAETNRSAVVISSAPREPAAGGSAGPWSSWP
jgi:hypothetical protein